MTVQAVPYALQNASHSAAVFRQAVSAAFQTPGILGAGELAVTQQGTPNMSVILGAGRAMVAGSQVSPPTGLSFTTQAMYNVLNDGSITLTVTTANATNPRIDAVYIGVQDAFYSGSNNQAVAGVVAGTPAASPVPPSIPVNSYLLGYIAVGANVTSIVTANITYQATRATFIGGRVAETVQFHSTAAQNAGATIDTMTLPSWPVATTVIIDAAGVMGNTSASVNNPWYQLTVSAGTLTQMAQSGPSIGASAWGEVLTKGTLALPANTASTITLVQQATVNQTIAKGFLSARRYGA